MDTAVSKTIRICQACGARTELAGDSTDVIPEGMALAEMAPLLL